MQASQNSSDVPPAKGRDSGEPNAGSVGRLWPYAAIVLTGAAFWVLPVALSSAFLLDDAELATIVRGWRLDYDSSQPPLYGWLSLAASSVFGVSIAASQLVRIAIFTLLFCAVYRLGCRITTHAWAPAVLLAGYIYLPILSWEGTHYQAHTVLLGLMTMAAFLLAVELRQRPSLAKFMLLGAVCGLGLLSKYTFVAILGSLFVAALTVKEYRAVLFRPAALVAFVVMLLIAVPPLMAVMLRLGEISSLPTITQEVTSQVIPFAERAWLGALGLFQQYTLQALLLVVMAGVAWAPAFFPAPLRRAAANPDFRFFAVQAAASFLITLAVVVGLGIDGISAHHPASLILTLPILTVLAVEAAGLLDGGRMWRARLYVGGAAVAVVVIWVALAWSLLAVFPKYFPSYEPLARAVRAAGGPEAVVIANRYRMAGPLRLHAPGFEVYGADLADRLPSPSTTPRSGGCVAVWWAKNGEAPPGGLVRYVERITGRAWANPGGNAVLAQNSTDGRAEPAASWFEALPAGGICAPPRQTGAPGG